MRIVCGLDVHKDSIFLCILSSTGEIFESHKSDVKDTRAYHKPSWQGNHNRIAQRVRMGRKPNQGLLLQPFLLPSDASQKKEQDESGGGHITQDARLRLAHPQRRSRLQGL